MIYVTTNSNDIWYAFLSSTIDIIVTVSEAQCDILQHVTISPDCIADQVAILNGVNWNYVNGVRDSLHNQ